SRGESAAGAGSNRHGCGRRRNFGEAEKEVESGPNYFCLIQRGLGANWVRFVIPRLLFVVGCLWCRFGGRRNLRSRWGGRTGGRIRRGRRCGGAGGDIPGGRGDVCSSGRGSAGGGLRSAGGGCRGWRGHLCG